METTVGDQWHELSIRRQRREIAAGLSTWKHSVEFRTVVAPVLRSMAEQLAESHGNGESVDLTISSRFEMELFEAFDAGIYDAKLGRERYNCLERSTN